MPPGQRGFTISKAKDSLHIDNRVHDYHRSGCGYRHIDRKQPSKARCCKINSHASVDAVVKAARCADIWAGQSYRNDECCRGQETDHGSCKQVVKADEGQQCRSKHRANQLSMS